MTERARVPGQLPGDLTLRRPAPSDHPRLQVALAEWWGGLGGEAGALQRQLLVPRLFLQHFADTSFLVERPDRTLHAFLIGFLSQTDPRTAYIHFVGVCPEGRMGRRRQRPLRPLLHHGPRGRPRPGPLHHQPQQPQLHRLSRPYGLPSGAGRPDRRRRRTGARGLRRAGTRPGVVRTGAVSRGTRRELCELGNPPGAVIREPHASTAYSPAGSALSNASRTPAKEWSGGVP